MCGIDWSFFDKDFFKNFFSALIGTGTALLIFYMTLRSDKKKSKEEEEQQNQRRLNYLSNIITATKNQAESFVKNLEKSILTFKKLTKKVY